MAKVNESQIQKTLEYIQQAEHELNNYSDVAQLRTQAEKRYDECPAADKEAQHQKEDKARGEAEAAAAKKKRNTILGVLAAVIAVAVLLVVAKVVIPGNKYKEAEQLRADGKYEEAVAIFTELGEYSDAATQITETQYQHAQALYAQKNYAGAAAIYITIKGYKDVDKLLVNDETISAAAATAAAHEAAIAPYKQVGSYATFGTYPQTSAGTDATAIEWLVLDYDAKGNRALLISRYVLDCELYNASKMSVTWETCTLRKWLNNDFFSKAFSSQQQTAILTTTVDNSKSQGYYDTNGGNNTQDKVFLLSYAEAWKYFKSDDARMCAPTDYAIKQGALTSSSYIVDGREACWWWWLRSPGKSSTSACSVNYLGACNYYIVSYDNDAVRPALWLDLSSDIF